MTIASGSDIFEEAVNANITRQIELVITSSRYTANNMFTFQGKQYYRDAYGNIFRKVVQ